jgi:hypothetical protein
VPRALLLTHIHLGRSGRAFVGDTGGVRIAPAELTLPPTPPPEDLEAWNESLSRIAEWQPQSLGITHFGAIDASGEPFEQLATMRDRLAAWATLARELDGAAFEQHIRDEVAAGTPDPDTAAAYEQAVPPEQQWLGLDRYWRKRERRPEASCRFRRGARRAGGSRGRHPGRSRRRG